MQFITDWYQGCDLFGTTRAQGLSNMVVHAIHAQGIYQEVQLKRPKLASNQV